MSEEDRADTRGEGRETTDRGPGAPPTAKSGAGALKVVGIGCGALLVVLVVVGAIVLRNVRRISTDLVHEGIVEEIRKSDLSENQKKGIEEHVNRLAEEFKAGRVTVEEVRGLVAELSEGPLLPLAMALVAEKRYVEESNLSPEEKADASLHIQRFARGVAEGRIDTRAVVEVIERISNERPDGTREMKESLDEEDLRAFIGDMKERADRADVPMERFEVDIAAEVGKAIDRILEDKGPPGGAPSALEGG